MQTFLTRARTATSSCHCSLCHPPRATIPRRFAVAARSRRPGSNDATSTLFFGTMMAAALYTDAAVKIGARNKLDRELEQTKEAIVDLEKDNQARLAKLNIAAADVQDRQKLLPIAPDAAPTPGSEHPAGPSSRRLIRKHVTRGKLAMEMKWRWCESIEEKEASGRKWRRSLVPDKGASSGQIARRLPVARRRHKVRYFVDEHLVDAGLLRRILRRRKIRMSPLAFRARLGRSHWTAKKHKVPARLRANQSTRYLEQDKTAEIRQLGDGRRLGQRNDSHSAKTPPPDNSIQHTIPTKRANTSIPKPRDASPKFVSRSAEQLWNTPFVFQCGQYWRNRRELVLALTVCRLLKFGVENDMILEVDLGLDEAHPLSGKTLNKEILRERIQAYSEHYLTIKAFTKLRKNEQVVSGMYRPGFPRFRPADESQDPIGETARVHSLNNLICKAFQIARSPGQALSSVCEILARSDVPPNVHTFNILLLNFPRFGIPEVCGILDNALRASGITRNEITITALLQAYLDTRRPRKFCELASSLDARVGRNFWNLDNSNTELLADGADILTGRTWSREQAEDRNLASASDKEELLKVHDKLKNVVTSGQDRKPIIRVPLSEELYETLIAGYNDFNEISLAAQMLARMKENGMGKTAAILNSILRRHINDPNLEFLDHLLDYFVGDRITGPKTDLTETLYLFFNAYAARRRIVALGEDVDEAEIAKLDEWMGRLNGFAAYKKLIITPLRFQNFSILSREEQDRLRSQLQLIRRLERPVVNLRFAAEGTTLLTASSPKQIWFRNQPPCLQTYVEERLQFVHQRVTQQRSYAALERKRFKSVLPHTPDQMHTPAVHYHGLKGEVGLPVDGPERMEVAVEDESQNELRARTRSAEKPDIPSWKLNDFATVSRRGEETRPTCPR